MGPSLNQPDYTTSSPSYQPPTEQSLESSDSTNISGLADLAQLTDTVMKRGSVTTADIDFLKAQANIYAPSLTPPDQAQINHFISVLSTSVGGKTLPMCDANPFLNCSAILALFIMTSAVIVTLSKIQLSENLYKAKLALVQKDMATASANATKMAGEIDAQKDLAQAAKAGIDAGLAMAGVFVAISTFLAAKIETNRQMSDYQKNATGRGAGINQGDPLTADEKIKIQTHVDTQIQSMRSGLDGLTQMMRSINEATMHKKLADYDIQSASARALADLMRQLLDIVSQTASMLGKSADQDMGKSIQSMMDSFTSAVQKYGEIGTRG